MGVFAKVKDFIFQEPQNKNVSPKVVVVLRMTCLLCMLYLLGAGVGFTVMRRGYLATFSAMFLVLYGYAYYCTYQDRLVQAFFLLNFNTLLWVVMFYVIFGEATGVQHFILVLIVVDLMVDRHHPIRTLLILYAVRMCLYILQFFGIPLTNGEMLGGIAVYMFVLSILLEAAAVLFNGIYFTKDAFQMESRLQEYNKELKQVASTDPLTKVWNRFWMLEHVEKCLKHYRKGEMHFMSVAIGDIDFFKRVNDTYGHECGDEVLRALASLFKEEMRDVDAVARWGGEEFLFLFENMNGDEAWTALSMIQTKINRMEIPYEDQVIHVTMTFGLVEYDFHLSLDDNIKLADDKLYRGKEQGRDRIIY